MAPTRNIYGEGNKARLARQVSPETQHKDVSTYAQDGNKLEYESRTKDRQLSSRQHKEGEKKRKREIARIEYISQYEGLGHMQ